MVTKVVKKVKSKKSTARNLSAAEDKELRGYEMVLVISPELAEDKFNAALDGISKLITDMGGVVSENRAFASQCVNCGECVEQCPQNLPIPELLEDVKKDMEGFTAKPLIWLIKRVLKVRRKER